MPVNMEILEEVNDMTLSDVLGVLLEARRTDLVANWDSIQEFLVEIFNAHPIEREG